MIRIMAYKDPNDPRSKESKRRHYERNKQKYIDRAKQQKQELIRFVHELKESSPCVDCGINYPYWVMHYDHTENNKIGNVSRIALSGSKRRVLDEIAKCDLVCSNCHATRTHARIHNMPLTYEAGFDSLGGCVSSKTKASACHRL